MTRQLRIEYPGACYHVYSRGNQKQAIFLADEDRYYFIKCLRDAFERFGCVYLGYCLMANHYHLFLRTLSGHLSQIMHMVNRAYAAYFNKKYEGVGHIFQGRYKSILVDADVYAQELSAYIHLNPVEAGITDLPEKYPWSNYREYVGLRDPESWMDVSFVLGLFGSEASQSRRRYAEYVISKIGRGTPEAVSEAYKSGIMAGARFIDRLKSIIPPDAPGRPDRNLPQLRRIRNRPSLDAVRALTESILGPGNRLARNAALYISHKNTDYSLRELGEFFRLGMSTITESCRKVKKQLPSNETLAQAVRDVEKRLFG